jgi:glucuronate isomerase
MNVEVVCTTDDPVDDLQHHRRLQKDERCSVAVYPAFRADKAMAVEDTRAYQVYLRRLGQASSVEIRDFSSLLEALRVRHDYFQGCGCRLSDHGLETIYAEEYTEKDVSRAFDRLLRGELPDLPDRLKLTSAILYELAVMDWEKGWTQQFHLGAMRNANSRMMRSLGPDTGFDSIGDFEIGGPLARFLDRLENHEKLTKTILYNLNPRDNELIATMIGNFQDGSVVGKIQYGSAWWFLDQLDGMTNQLNALSNMGLLSQFIGMLTDSRSFLSFPRHEYFRRMLCNILGSEIRAGLLPEDIPLVGKMVRDICYFNARRYFQFPARSGAGAQLSEEK